MSFEEPENRQGQSAKRSRKARISDTTPVQAASSGSSPPQPTPVWQPGAWPQPPPYPPFWYGWPQYNMPPYGPHAGPQPPTLSQPPRYGQPSASSSSSSESPSAVSLSTASTAPPSRQRDWRRRKAAQEDQERIAKGQLPKKRHKMSEKYQCSMCQKQKSTATGHTQIRGKWYCPSLGLSVEEWKEQLTKP